MADEQQATSKVKMPLKIQLALAAVFIAGLVILLIFAVSPRVAEAFTAAGTVSLAVATVWLADQTRKAVEVNESEMAQNRELLTLTRQQAHTAELSTKILVESNRPFVSIRQEQQLGVSEVNGISAVRIPIHNYGASVAFIEMGNHRPSAILAQNGDRFSIGTPGTVVLPAATNGYMDFRFDKVSRVGGPVMRADGTYIALSLDYWFTDVSKTTHYGVHAEFDLADDRILRLTNIEFGPPIEIQIDGRDPRSIPHYLLDQGTLS
jgi:hypothetical protein